MSIIAITLATRHLLRRRRELLMAEASDLMPSFTPGDFLKGALQACHRTLLQAVEPLTEDEMSWRPYPETASAGFLVWHVARVQDALVHQQLLKKEEVWVTQGWSQQFGMTTFETGQDYTPEQIAQFQEPSKDELLAYLGAVVSAAVRAIDGLGPKGLDVSTEKGMARVRYLVTLVNHANMHAGGISYIRDMLTAGREVPSER